MDQDGQQDGYDLPLTAGVSDAVSIPVVVDGDIRTGVDAGEALARSGADGVMIGRGAYGRPWFLHQVIHYLRTGERLPEPPLAHQLALLLAHFEDMLVHYGHDIAVRVSRKHFGWYSKGLPGSNEFRAAVNRLADADAVRQAIDAFYGRLIERRAA